MEDSILDYQYVGKYEERLEGADQRAYGKLRDFREVDN